jgi:hypothetical protein
MKTSILLLFFSLMISLSPAYSQSSQLGLTVGVGLPFGDFADTDADNDDAGFAKTGYNINVFFDHAFSENIGIASSLTYGSNTLDENVLDDFLGLTTRLETKPYSQLGLFAGLLAQFPGKGATFKLRAMPGLVFSKSYGLEASDFGIVIELDPVNATSFGIKIGGGIDVPVSDKIKISGNVDFHTYKAKYEGDIDTNWGIIFNNQKWEQPTSLINISIGVGFTL